MAAINNKKNHLPYNYLALLVVIVLLNIAGAGWVATDYLGKIAKKEIIQANESALSILSIYFTHAIKGIEGGVEAMSGSPWIAPALITQGDQEIAKANSVLDRYNASLGVTVCYLINKNGVTIASSNRQAPDSFVGSSYEFRPYFTQAMQGKPGQYLALGVTSGKRGAFASHPVRDHQGKIIGVAVIKKDLDEIETYLGRYPLGFVVDQHGVIFLSSQKGMLLKSLWPIDREREVALIASRQFGDKPFSALLPREIMNGQEITFNRSNYYVSRKMLNPAGWSLVLMAPQDKIFHYRLIGFVVTILVGSLAVILAIISHMTLRTLDRARAEKALRESERTARRLAQENELLAEIGRIISSTPDIDAVYERFADKIRAVIPFDNVSINIVNLAHDTRTIRYTFGMSVKDRRVGDVVSLQGSITERIVRARSGLLINVKDHEELAQQYPGMQHTIRSGFRSIMAVPLISKDEVIGTFLLRSVKPEAYIEADLRLAERVGTQIAGAIANAQLLLERQQAEEALKESEAKYYDLYENAPDMYYSLDLATATIRGCNETMIRTTGYSKQELIGRPIFELYDTGSANDAQKSLQQFPVTGEVRDAERRVKCQDGRIIDVSLNVSAIRDKDGNIMYSRSIWRDITERKKYEEIINSLSITDQLTGLYNRRGFITLAEQQLRIAERTKSGLLFLYADLDGLKRINDKLGHKWGDEAIVEAAHVLKEVLRKMDIIARMGGDEFVVLAPDASLEYSGMIRNRLQAQLDIRNARAGRDYYLSLSIGMVYHDPTTPTSLDALISRADALMYEHKQRKKS